VHIAVQVECMHQNELNLKLQGSKHVIMLMYNSVKSFRCKLSLWAKQLQSGNLAQFQALQSLAPVEPECLKAHSAIISQLLEDSDGRFQDLWALKPQFALSATPFSVDTDCISEDLQTELLQSHIMLHEPKKT